MLMDLLLCQRAVPFGSGPLALSDGSSGLVLLLLHSSDPHFTCPGDLSLHLPSSLSQYRSLVLLIGCPELLLLHPGGIDLSDRSFMSWLWP